MPNTTRKGYNKCTEFDKMAEEMGWVKIFGEHRYRTGPIFRCCNIFGFDRLYMTLSGPVLVEVTDAGDRAGHRQVIVDRLHLNPLLTRNFRIALVVYYGGHKKIDKHKKEKTWTKGGTWEMEWFN